MLLEDIVLPGSRNYSETDTSFPSGRNCNSRHRWIYSPTLPGLSVSHVIPAVPNNNNPVNIVRKMRIRGAANACGFHTVCQQRPTREIHTVFLYISMIVTMIQTCPVVGYLCCKGPNMLSRTSPSGCGNEDILVGGAGKKYLRLP
jgi:hypothetical protein